MRLASPVNSSMLRVCTRCVMDTTDPEIVFDDRGVCNHCHVYDRNIQTRVFTGAEAKARLRALVDRVKADGRGKEYDCIIGISGGVDSTYVACQVKELGLRPLAAHLDNGWDSELAVKNIEQMLKKVGIELYTHVIDWNEFRDLQLSFLKASVPDAEIPSDHSVVATLYQAARKIGTRWILSGVNCRTESHLPRAWSQARTDWKYIREIHRRFGSLPLTTFPRQGFFRMMLDRTSIRWVDILNYLDYSKKGAMAVLEAQLGWKYYGGKHYESLYTRFYQGYFLPRKFGYDKRKSHLSSLVCSGEISREEALKELEKPPYPEELQAQDRDYVIKKFGLTAEEFERIMALPPKRFEDHPSYAQSGLYRWLKAIYQSLKRP